MTHCRQKLTFGHKFINKSIDVLIEQFDKNLNCYVGHAKNYIEVKIPSVEGKIGEYYTIEHLKKDDIIN